MIGEREIIPTKSASTTIQGMFSSNSCASQIVLERVIVITHLILLCLTSSGGTTFCETLSTLLVDVVQAEGVDHDQDKTKSSEAHSNSRASDVARRGLGCEDLTNYNSGRISDAESDAQRSSTFVVAGEIAVEPHDG